MSTATTSPQNKILSEILHFNPKTASTRLMQIHDRALYHSNELPLSQEDIEGLYLIKILSGIIDELPNVSRIEDLEKAQKDLALNGTA